MKKELFDDIEGEVQNDKADVVQLVGLKLGDEEYAIDVLKIQEIIRMVEITIVPRMENYILGVMNLRGKVIPVIDLRIRFNLDKLDFEKTTRIIVVRFEKQNIGFVVDEVTEVIRINKSMVEPTPPLVGAIGQEYVLGICRYDNRLIMLLDIDMVVNENPDDAESDLRKIMRGPNAFPEQLAPVAPDPQKDESSKTVEAVIMPSEPIEKQENLPAPDKVPSPIISDVKASTSSQGVVEKDITKHPEEDAISQGSSDADVEGDIDALIAQELAKREAETDELNKKKRIEKESGEDVLKDALKQSDALLKKNDVSNHVEQEDLDALIAQELAKREHETDELNLKHREEKKNKLNANLPMVEPAGVLSIEYPVNSDDKSDLLSITKDLSDNKKISSTDSISMKELKNIVEKIIAGEKPKELDMDVKGEIGELLRLIVSTKAKVDQINPIVTDSQAKLPQMATVLESVNKSTEKATVNLMDASNDMSAFYKDFIQDIHSLQSLLIPGKEKDFMVLHEKICSKLSDAENLGFKVLESLEFQDITEQQIRKVLGSIEEIGGRIGTIVGYLKFKSSKVGEEKRNDKLLSDYGLV